MSPATHPMEGGGRGGRGAPCNPSVILFIMCFLSGVIGWQMGHRHGAELARQPPCPDLEAAGPCPPDASSDAVRITLTLPSYQQRLVLCVVTLVVPSASHQYSACLTPAEAAAEFACRPLLLLGHVRTCRSSRLAVRLAGERERRGA